MAVSDLRMTVLEITNEVRKRLAINTVTSMTADKKQQKFLNFLNELIDELADFGDWQELYEEVTIIASAGTFDYTFGVTYPIHHIYEVAFGTDTTPLIPQDIKYIRQLERIGSTNATPRHYTVKGVDNKGNPGITVWPAPTTAQQSAATSFDIAVYKKPPLFTTNQGSERPVFPAQLLIQGLYVKALVDDEAGRITNQSQLQLQIFEKMRREAHNRFTSDTDTNVRFVPG